jgi:hypothetical protein
VGFGDDTNLKYPTTYFRRSFQVSGANEIDGLTLRMFRDDGVVVYLNGNELIRSGFDETGNIAFSTFANTTTNEGAFLEFEIPAGNLVEGDNILALEIHQGTPRSSDMGFDLELLGIKETTTSDPIVVDGGILVKARVLSQGEWSPIAEALFQPGGRSQDLVVSEMMYHPPVGGAEFLELTNEGAILHSLNDLRIAGGITFLFGESGMSELGPGESLVLVRDAGAFAAVYPGVAFAGVYDGALGNGGDEFSLETVDSQVLWTVTYDDAGAWPQSTDGEGRSLTYRGGSLGLPESWRPSSVVNGTPGEGDRFVYQAGSDPLEYAIVASVLNERGRFEVGRKLNADNARIEVEASVDLQSWSTESVMRATQRLEESNVIEEFYLDGVAENQARFFRVKVIIESP